MEERTVSPDTAEINLSPEAFHKWARQFHECGLAFSNPGEFSPVPYFLCTRAIELELKSRHLVARRQKEVKHEYKHDVDRLYSDLPADQRILTDSDLDILRIANELYMSKAFEYFAPYDALTAFKRFPDLTALRRIASMLLENHYP